MRFRICACRDIYTSQYRSEFVIAAGGADKFAMASKPANTSALMELLKGVDVLIDETYSTTPRNFRKADFLALYGITSDMVASGLWPFLTNSARPPLMHVDPLWTPS